MIARLLRYAVSGGASALTHFGIGLALAEGLHVRPVAASTAGFVARTSTSSSLLSRSTAFVSRSKSGLSPAARAFFTPERLFR